MWTPFPCPLLTPAAVRHHDALMLRPHTPLFNVATDASNGGGDTPSPSTAAPAVETPPAPESPSLQVSESSAPKPGVIAQAVALLRGANGNAATIAALRSEVTTRDATIEQLRSDLAARDATIASLNTELATYRTQAADLQTAVTALQTKATDVQTEVIHQLAAAGLPENKLPAGSTSTQVAQTPEELWAAAEAADDPKQKGALANQALAASAKIKAAREKAALN